MKDILNPVIWQGRKFFGISEFDCRSIVLFTGKTLEGTYSTYIPISDLKAKQNNPTKAKVQISHKGNWTIFNIHDDWGHLHTMKIHNSLNEKIEYARQKAIENLLMKSTSRFHTCGKCNVGKIETIHTDHGKEVSFNIKKCSNDKCKHQYYIKELFNANLKEII